MRILKKSFINSIYVAIGIYLLTLIPLVDSKAEGTATDMGGAGYAWVCRNSDRTLKSVELYDYAIHKTGQRYKLLLIGSTYEEKVRNVINRIKLVEPERGLKYARWFQEFLDDGGFETHKIDDTNFKLKTINIKTENKIITLESKNCKREMFAAQFFDPPVGSLRFLINGTFFEKAEENHRAGIIIHELAKRDEISNKLHTKDKDKEVTIPFTFLISSTLLNQDPIQREDYLRMLKESGRYGDRYDYLRIRAPLNPIDDYKVTVFASDTEPEMDSSKTPLWHNMWFSKNSLTGGELTQGEISLKLWEGLDLSIRVAKNSSSHMRPFYKVYPHTKENGDFENIHTIKYDRNSFGFHIESQFQIGGGKRALLDLWVNELELSKELIKLDVKEGTIKSGLPNGFLDMTFSGRITLNREGKIIKINNQDMNKGFLYEHLEHSDYNHFIGEEVNKEYTNFTIFNQQLGINLDQIGLDENLRVKFVEGYLTDSQSDRGYSSSEYNEGRFLKLPTGWLVYSSFSKIGIKAPVTGTNSRILINCLYCEWFSSVDLKRYRVVGDILFEADGNKITPSSSNSFVVIPEGSLNWDNGWLDEFEFFLKEKNKN